MPLLNYFTDGDQVIGYNFHDINAKVNYRFSAKDHLYMSSYLGRDRFYSQLNPTCRFFLILDFFPDRKWL